MERRPDPHVCVELFPVLPPLLPARAVKDARVSPRRDWHHLQGWVSASGLRRGSGDRECALAKVPLDRHWSWDTRG